MPLRRAGTVSNACLRYDPGSARTTPRRAARCAASGERGPHLSPLFASPPLRKPVQRQEGAEQFLARLREAIAAGGHQLDKAGLPQLGQPRLQHGRGGVVAGLAQRARCQRRFAQLPQYPQRPAPAQQVEQRHDRAAGSRAAHRAFFQCLFCHQTLLRIATDNVAYCYVYCSTGVGHVTHRAA